MATAPIGPLARKLPYAVGIALKRQKEKKKEIPLSEIPGSYYSDFFFFLTMPVAYRSSRPWDQTQVTAVLTPIP